MALAANDVYLFFFYSFLPIFCLLKNYARGADTDDGFHCLPSAWRRRLRIRRERPTHPEMASSFADLNYDLILILIEFRLPYAYTLVTHFHACIFFGIPRPRSRYSTVNISARNWCRVLQTTSSYIRETLVDLIKNPRSVHRKFMLLYCSRKRARHLTRKI